MLLQAQSLQCTSKEIRAATNRGSEETIDRHKGVTFTHLRQDTRMTRLLVGEFRFKLMFGFESTQSNVGTFAFSMVQYDQKIGSEITIPAVGRSFMTSRKMPPNEGFLGASTDTSVVCTLLSLALGRRIAAWFWYLAKLQIVSLWTRIAKTLPYLYPPYVLRLRTFGHSQGHILIPIPDDGH